MNTAARPRTMQAAFVAELLEDAGRIVERAEQLPALVDGVETRLTRSADALNDAGERYRQAVTTFTNEAKAELATQQDMHQATAARAAAKLLDDSRQAMHEAARAAFNIEAAQAMNQGAARSSRTPWTAVLTHCAAAAVASLGTALFFLTVMR